MRRAIISSVNNREWIWTWWCVLAIGLLLMCARQGLAQDDSDFSMPAEGSDAGGSGSAGDDPGSPPAGGGEDFGLGEASGGGDSGGGGGVAAAGGGGGDDNDSELTLEQKLEKVFTTHSFSPGNPNKDPFKPLVEKKLPPPPTPVAVRPAGSNQPPPPPPPPPIKLTVQGICGNDAERLAMVMFDNKFMTITKNQTVDGKFKVVDILNDKVVIYSNREKIRRSFSVGGGSE